MLGPYQCKNHINVAVVRSVEVDGIRQPNQRERGALTRRGDSVRHCDSVAESGGAQRFSAGERGFYVSIDQTSRAREPVSGKGDRRLLVRHDGAQRYIHSQKWLVIVQCTLRWLSVNNIGVCRSVQNNKIRPRAQITANAMIMSERRLAATIVFVARSISFLLTQTREL